VSQVDHPAHHDIPTYLLHLQMPGIILAVIFAVWYVYTWGSKNHFQRQIAGPLLIAALCYMGGAALGLKLEESPHEPVAAHADHAGHADHAEADHAKEAVAEAPAADPNAAATAPASNSFAATQAHPEQVLAPAGVGVVPRPDVNQKGKAGLFFSVYYCMTGVHALHILGGMAVISWLIVKAARKEFHSKYFGPVDNVGLYWHLVDFIWIYLFPLLYLIT
jgi:cytochrome c oxidase subunit III